MKKYWVIKLFIIPLLFMPLLFGCLPGAKREVVGPKTPPVSPPPLASDMLDKKIIYLTNILDDKGLNDEDREVASDLLTAYKTIRSGSRENSASDYRKIIHILFENLSQLEEKYFLKEKIKNQQYSKAINIFSIKRKMILDNYLYGNYQGVMNDCLELEASFGPDALTPEIGIVFALSLAKKGFLEEAVNIGERIVRELEGKPDLIHLRASIIEWQLDLGNREKALKVYDKLTDNLDEGRDIFRKAEKSVTRKIAAHDQGEVSPDTIPYMEMDIREPGSMEQLFKEVDTLVLRHEFHKAKLLLVRQRIKLQEGPEIETLDQALKTVELAEIRFQEEESREALYENETLKLAKKLIEEENFEEAITRLERIDNDTKLTPETRKLKELAVEKLINSERNKAAKLFLMAKNTSNPEKKRDLLLSSYKKLEVLIDKYPSSNLIDKLIEHIKKVREGLIKLGADPG